MKSLVNTLASSVRRYPIYIIVAVIVISFVSGGLGGQFQPAEDQNESFAPEAAELTAASLIGETFGATARMQVVSSSADGDVITLSALQAAIAMDETLRASDAAGILVDTPQSPAIVSHLAPVFFALDGGAPFPQSDAEVKQLYLTGLEQLPPAFASFLQALLSDDADLSNATAELGLSSITYESSDDFDELAERALQISDAVAATPGQNGVTLEAFSVELIFASGEDFQTEVLRLLAAAGLIILLVLAIIFLVRPNTVRDRGLFVGGVVLMLLGAGVAVAPGLSLLFPDVFPESWGEAELGPVLGLAVSFYALAFVLWSWGARKLRRTTADTLLTFVTIGFAIQWMNAYGFLRFEDQSQLVQILPILLIGLGVDYSIHMNTRYRQEIHGGRSVDSSVTTAIRTVGIALVLATLTTAVGFLTNVTNDIPALAEFGELAAVGIVFSFLLMLTFVPAVRQVLDRRSELKDELDRDGLEGGESRALPKLIGRTSVLPRRLAAGTIVIALVITAFGGLSMTNLSTKFSFLDFVPTTSPLRDTAITVDERFDFPETSSVLVTGEVTTGAAWNAMLASYVGAADVESVQSIETQGGERFPNGSTFMGLMFQFLSPSGDLADQELFDTALSLGVGQDRTFPVDADLTPLYDLAVQKYPAQMAGVLGTIGDTYDAALYNIDTVAGEAGAADLADGLNEAFAPTADAGLESVATSNFIINDLVVTTLRDSQVSSLLLTMGAALLLLVINFWFESRRPMLGVITTLPVAMVVIWVFGLMAAFNIPFGPVTATISALGIGIGIPYMIHVTHRYLEERIEQANENEAIEQTLTFTGGALAGSAVTTIAGFGILVTSTTIPFRQFGFVIAYTILLALSAAVLVLPSLLVLWDRWHRRRGDVTVDADVIHSALQDEDEAPASV
ncbi:MAG: MMPL family transporter [Acidimicrobiia bacterium]|nr:MMPL family transporter [Acidimicrobiia bacterium]